MPLTSLNAESLLESLNDAQRAAVGAPLQHLLVLAGAGSGKTRVLVHRIAWLLAVENHTPFNILAVTFTNKAANEMRARIEALLGASISTMWVGTFHGLAHRLLRLHWQEAGLTENFQILDSDDQHRLIRRIVNTLGLDEKQWSPKQVQWFINGQKDKGLRSHQINDKGDLHTRTLVRIYQQYEEACTRSGAVDFAELLLRAHELWQTCPDILAHYQMRFRSVLVDEFQDTNKIQYEWIRAIATQGHLMVVGDDDQSIYGWRGAEAENMQRLEKDFKLTLLRLEQNYRSTRTILQAANALIANNSERFGKNLWTDGAEGEPIRLYAAFNEIEEARFIIDSIRESMRKGGRYEDCAVLYRSNAQSRVIEEALIQAGIPYRIYGGLKFFERAEIKDALGYLRLLSNRHDDGAFERVVNLPARGIGEQTLNTVRDYAKRTPCSLWQATQVLITDKTLSARASGALASFMTLIDSLALETADMTLPELTEHVLHGSGLIRHFRAERGEKAQTRVENLEELISATRQFQEEDASLALSPLTAFLANAALEAGESQSADSTDCVQLMTLHAAKGLEFPIVFMAGVEEGLFPHQLSVEDPSRLSEERRLCYVGMTRAMQKLFMTYAETRRLHGTEMYHRPSRFIKELPSNLVHEVRMRGQTMQPQATRSPYMPSKTANKFLEEENTGFRLGQRVQHPVFGEGVVLSAEGQGSHARIQVKFNRVGAKWLVMAYAKLEAVTT